MIDKIDIGDVLVCTVEKGEDNTVSLKCSVIKEEKPKNYGNYEGIVVDEELAKKSPCYQIDDTELIYSKGIIGVLNDEQVKKYCPVIYKREAKGSDKLCVTVDNMDKLEEVVRQIQQDLKGML